MFRRDPGLLVLAFGHLAHAWGGVEQEGTREVHGRLDSLVEDAHLRAVADADDVPVDEHRVSRAQLADGLLGRGEGDALLGHQASLS